LLKELDAATLGKIDELDGSNRMIWAQGMPMTIHDGECPEGCKRDASPFYSFASGFGAGDRQYEASSLLYECPRFVFAQLEHGVAVFLSFDYLG
jgi:hypothetical protein